MDSRLITIEEDTLNANVVKELIIQKLYDNGVLNEEQAKTYVEKWQVIVYKPTWFKRWMEKFVTTNKDTYRYKYVKFED